jgi:hypothetical protein
VEIYSESKTVCRLSKNHIKPLVIIYTNRHTYFTLYGDRIVPDHTTCNLQPDDVDLGLLVFTNYRFPKQCSDENAQASSWIYECKHEMRRNILKTFCRLQLCACSTLACSVSSKDKQTSMDLQAV